MAHGSRTSTRLVRTTARTIDMLWCADGVWLSAEREGGHRDDRTSVGPTLVNHHPRLGSPRRRVAVWVPCDAASRERFDWRVFCGALDDACR